MRAERAGLHFEFITPIPSGREVSILNVRGGAEKVRFASRAHVERHLPGHRADAIAAWCNLIRHIGGDIDLVTVTQVPIRVQRPAFEEHEAEFAKCLASLSRAA